MEEGKAKALESVLVQIEKQYGKGAIMKLGQDAGDTNIEVIPTGCLALDLALGIGGFPRGRMIEIYGPESSGKTTVALHAIAETQKLGGIAAFIDAEHALDPVYAKNLGVDLDNLYVSQPDTGEQALDITDHLVRSGAIDLIVIDSVAALTPKAEIEGEMGDSHVGLQARLMSQALRKLAGITNKSKTCVIFINQLREKVGIMFGNPEVTPGGKALKFYASVRIDVRRRLSKTSWRLPSARRSSISFTAREFPARAVSWIWESSTRSSKRAARGSRTTTRRSPRAGIRRATISRQIPKLQKRWRRRSSLR